MSEQTKGMPPTRDEVIEAWSGTRAASFDDICEVARLAAQRADIAIEEAIRLADNRASMIANGQDAEDIAEVEQALVELATAWKRAAEGR